MLAHQAFRFELDPNNRTRSLFASRCGASRCAFKWGLALVREQLAVGGKPPYFTDAERAALALTEAGTRLADKSDPVPDEVFAEAARHFDEKALAVLVACIAMINTWNRLNVITGQVAGEWTAQWVS